MSLNPLTRRLYRYPLLFLGAWYTTKFVDRYMINNELSQIATAWFLFAGVFICDISELHEHKRISVYQWSIVTFYFLLSSSIYILMSDNLLHSAVTICIVFLVGTSMTFIFEMTRQKIVFPLMSRNRKQQQHLRRGRKRSRKISRWARAACIAFSILAVRAYMRKLARSQRSTF